MHFLSGVMFIPVAADEFVSVRFEQQRAQDIFYTGYDIFLWDAPQPGIHAQGFPPCHVI